MILPEWTIADLQEKMESGELTARRLAELYLERIEAVDKSGPYLNSVIELNPDVLEIADTLDEERRAGKTRGALHGIPILIKDNIDTHDRMQTTSGSLALEGNIPEKDAFVVRQLRRAGTLILGKTNLSEWANFRGKRSVSGWSSRGGLTRTPYALDRSACGSSSGSGAAVAANRPQPRYGRSHGADRCRCGRAVRGDDRRRCTRPRLPSEPEAVLVQLHKVSRPGRASRRAHRRRSQHGRDKSARPEDL